MSFHHRYIYCGNCGKPGHIYKDCDEPIISLGIILYREIEGIRKYLMIMRKDSLGYVELIRGNYPLDNLQYLHNIFDEMTLTEKYKICTQGFDVLWNEMWVEDEEKKQKYKNEFYKAMKKFNRLYDGVTIEDTHVSIKSLVEGSKTKWESPEWGFPKGRRNLKEKDLACALREFEEETDISSNLLDVKMDIEPVEETFTGSNNKCYRHIYYVAHCKRDITPSINKNKPLQMIEIGDIQWLNFSQVIQHIRKYNVEKRNVIRTVEHILESTSVESEEISRNYMI